MLQKSQCAGQPSWALAIICVYLCLASQPVLAWDDNALSATDPNATVVHPQYNTILAEKISRNRPYRENDPDQSLLDAALNPPDETPLALRSEPGNVGATALGTRFSAGWDMPLGDTLSTGPVAQYAVDQSPLNCQQCEVSEQLNHNHIASFGWRVDSQMGWIAPWAQLSYSHQLGDNMVNNLREGDSTEMAARQENWVDVSVGAHMPLNNNLAAFASFSQTGALSTGEQFIYSLGVSASF